MRCFSNRWNMALFGLAQSLLLVFTLVRAVVLELSETLSNILPAKYLFVNYLIFHQPLGLDKNQIRAKPGLKKEKKKDLN